MKIKRIIIILIFSIVLSESIFPAENILKNPGFENTLDTLAKLGNKLSVEEISSFKSRTNNIIPKRCSIKKLSNGGWTFISDSNEPFIPMGIEYEPLAIYGDMNWELIERDLTLIKQGGFNTLTVWSIDFNASGGAGRRMSIEEMVRLTDLANQKGLFHDFLEQRH